MGLKLSSKLPGVPKTIGDELLRVHKNYSPPRETAERLVKGWPTSPAAA